MLVAGPAEPEFLVLLQQPAVSVQRLQQQLLSAVATAGCVASAVVSAAVAVLTAADLPESVELQNKISPRIMQTSIFVSIAFCLQT